MTIWYILSDLDSLCLECPIPDGCRETDQRCLYRQALIARNVSRRIPGRREQVLEYLAENADIWYSIVDVAHAINASRSSVTGILLKLRRQGKVEHTGKKRALRVRSRD